MYESYEDSRNIYIIMELCEGGELFDRIININNQALGTGTYGEVLKA